MNGVVSFVLSFLISMLFEMLILRSEIWEEGGLPCRGVVQFVLVKVYPFPMNKWALLDCNFFFFWRGSVISS